jgi:hypothetical protein
MQIEEMFLRVMKQEKHWIEDIVVSYKDGSELISSVCIPKKKKSIHNLDNFKLVGL